MPVRFADPKEGSLVWSTGLVLHAQAPNLDLAYEAIDSMLSPEVGAYVLEQIGFGHSNRKTYESFSAEKLAAIGQPADPSGDHRHGRSRCDCGGTRELGHLPDPPPRPLRQDPGRDGAGG